MIGVLLTYLPYLGILAWGRVGSQFLRIGTLPLGVVEGPFHLLSPKLSFLLSMSRGIQAGGLGAYGNVAAKVEPSPLW